MTLSLTPALSLNDATTRRASPTWAAPGVNVVPVPTVVHTSAPPVRPRACHVSTIVPALTPSGSTSAGVADRI